jgi:hypothetical protein
MGYLAEEGGTPRGTIQAALLDGSVKRNPERDCPLGKRGRCPGKRGWQRIPVTGVEPSGRRRQSSAAALQSSVYILRGVLRSAIGLQR